MLDQQLNNFMVLIPAYNPDEALFSLVQSLLAASCQVVLVDDGSTKPESRAVLQRCEEILKVKVLRQYVNLGKGAALKLGLNHIAVEFAGVCGVVTADADGQHVVADIVRVGQALVQNPDDLVLGVRSFDTKVPFRSRFGNSLTRFIFNFVTGLKLLDTQTGLRGIPIGQISTYLKIHSNRYEFELDMLLQAKHHGYLVQQVLIQSIYINNNQSSHFNPLLDSMRIYFVLFRFILASILAFVVDYTIFMMSFGVTQNLLLSQYAARFISGGVNYTMNKRSVFSSKVSVARSLPRYVVLAVVLGFCSYLLIDFLVGMGISVALAKPLAEGLLFVASFSIQRHFVFSTRPA